MRIKTLIVSLAAVTLVAAPATAQNWRGSASVQRQIQNDISQLENQIQRSAQRRAISQREASKLRRSTLNLQRSLNRYSRNGLDRAEVAQLERQVNAVRHQLRFERRDGNRRRG